MNCQTCKHGLKSQGVSATRIKLNNGVTVNMIQQGGNNTVCIFQGSISIIEKDGNTLCSGYEPIDTIEEKEDN